MTDWLDEATDLGVWPQAVGGYTSDGDAYTLAGVSRPAPTGKPDLTTIEPPQFVIGSPSVVLHCYGSGFTRDCFIAFAGQAERTDFHDDTHVSTLIESQYWTSPDVVKVAVASQARGGSKTMDFPIVSS